MQTMSDKAQVVIIGGGIAGIAAALKLAQRGHPVIILERNRLLSGSSGRNPGRMGHGFHYFDFATAVKYLEASIAVQREFPGFLIGQSLPFSHPIRHGRYYITKTSMHSYPDIIALYKRIQEHYKALVTQDPLNKVFGEPEHFFRILKPSEYASELNADIIVGGVETNEHLFNWPAFAKFIRENINRTNIIRLFEFSEVVDVQQRANLASRFTLKIRRHEPGFAPREGRLNTNFIINSTWENIEYLNDKVGIRYVLGTRTNRLKCLLEVQLPPDLHMTNSSFFCMGSFCMFSNMGDGRGMLTLADITNMASTSDLKISSDIEAYLTGRISKQEQDQIAQGILDGVSLYIPKMSKATIIGLKFGIVQTKGHLDIADLKFSTAAAHHKRDYDGIREEQQGLISNPAMKLFYFPFNAARVWELFKFQNQRQKDLDLMMANLFYLLEQKILKKTLEVDLKKALLIHMDCLSVLVSPFNGDELEIFLGVFEKYLRNLHEVKECFLKVQSSFADSSCLSPSLVKDFNRRMNFFNDSVSSFVERPPNNILLRGSRKSCNLSGTNIFAAINSIQRLGMKDANRNSGLHIFS